MRYAIISDIHANAAALRAVLADAQDCGVEQVICLGDVLGYGPEPVETLELVYKRVHVCLAGNHDDAVCGRMDVATFNDFAADAVQRQRRLLAQNAMNWLKSLPYTWEKGEFACTHGEFGDPAKFGYIFDPEDAAPSWAARKEKLLFVGHTHEPGIFVIGPSGVTHKLDPTDFQLEAGKRFLVNPGSVGYPRVGNFRSSYVIFDTRTRVVTFRSLPFDLEGYREKMKRFGLKEAAWMDAREKERDLPALRGKVDFAVEQPKAAKRAVPQVPAVSKVAAIQSRQAESARVDAQAGRAVRTVLWLLVLVVLALVGLGVMWFEKDGRTAAPKTVTLAPSAPSEKTAPVPLVSGWMYELDDLQEQRIEALSGDGEAIVRMVHMKRRTMKLVKRVDVRGKSGKLAFQYRALPKYQGDIDIRIYFVDATGSEVNALRHLAKKSWKPDEVKIPANAVTAVAELGCTFEGELEIELPHFALAKKGKDGSGS